MLISSQDQSQDSHVLALIDGIGTLNLSNDGRSRFLGLSASSAFLGGDLSDSESVSSTPGTSEDLNETTDYHSPPIFHSLLGNSPFIDPTHPRSFLPERHEAERLGNVYFSYVFHLYELLTRIEFGALINEIYNDHRNEICTVRLALLYSIFSLGVLFDPTVPALHPDARKWYDLAETCLKSTDYLTNPSLATVQTIHLLGIYILNSRIDGAETYWPVLGTAMRLCQSMGLHRDGSNWGLASSELESRRRTFHELLSSDRLQSLVLGRPYAISDKHYDTLIPKSCLDKPEHPIELNADFSVAKWRFSSYIGRVVDDAFSVKPPSLAVVNRLDDELRQFDLSLSSRLKGPCTSPISQGPSWCDNPGDVKPRVNGAVELQLAMQQHFMSALENTTLLFLHRRAFALALSEAAFEPMNSSLSKNVLSVIVESSRNLVMIAQAAQTLYPELAHRWWYIFCHAYNGATCVATLLIKSPGCMLAKHAWATLSAAMSVFSMAAQSGPLCCDLFNRLTRLHKQALTTLNAYSSGDLLPNAKRLSLSSYNNNQTLLSPISNNFGEAPIALARYLESSQPQPNHARNDFPCELGASTRLTRKNRTQSMSNSSIASGRGPSLTSSSRSRGASFGSTGPNDAPPANLTIIVNPNASSTSSHSINRNNSTLSPNSNNGINGTLTTSFTRSSWAGVVNSPRDEFDEEEANPTCWENLSVDPGEETFNTPIFGVSHSHSQSNHYFEGFSEHFHPPMVLPSNDAMISAGTSNYGGIYGPMPNPTPGVNTPVSPNHNTQSQDANTATEVITSPTSTQFDLLDTFLTW